MQTGPLADELVVHAMMRNDEVTTAVMTLPFDSLSTIATPAARRC